MVTPATVGWRAPRLSPRGPARSARHGVWIAGSRAQRPDGHGVGSGHAFARGREGDHLSVKRSLYILALVIGLSAVTLWLATGADRGWTKTSVAVKTLDAITGIEGIEYRKRLVPGLDFLGAALLGAGLLAGAAVVIPKKQNQNAKR